MTINDDNIKKCVDSCSSPEAGLYIYEFLG